MAIVTIEPNQEITVDYIKGIQNAEIDNMRKMVYQSEADSLFFQSERGEIDKQVWLDKVEEIKKRFPKNRAI